MLCKDNQTQHAHTRGIAITTQIKACRPVDGACQSLEQVHPPRDISMEQDPFNNWQLGTVHLDDAGAADISSQLSFLEMGDDDRDRLRSIRPLLTAAGKEFVEAFYRHLFRFDETAKFLRDPILVERLKEAQQSHLESMLDASWDDNYVERRRRVGDKHAQVGINPQIFLGAYNQYLQFCFQRLANAEDLDKSDFIRSILSLLKAVFFDIGLTLDAYFLEATQKLRRALDLVFSTNAELRQFAQLTTHDLKTPLATMANLCDEAVDEFGDQMPAGARELIEAAKSRAFRMSQTIDELLSTTLAGESKTREVFASDLVVSQAADIIRPVLEEKGIDLAIAMPLPLVKGDPIRFREAIYNLLSNAAKYIDKESGRIDVSATVNGTECIFCVADNGPGIPAEELQRIFVPFRRLPMHRDRPGSGLGLYFTKNLVEQQSGRIWAESELGKGSRFYILLEAPSDAGN